MGKHGNRCWEEKKMWCPATGGRQAQCLFKAQGLEEHRGSPGKKLQHEKWHCLPAVCPALRSQGWLLPWSPAYVLSGLEVLWTTLKGAEAACAVAYDARPPLWGPWSVGIWAGLLHILLVEIQEVGTCCCSCTKLWFFMNRHVQTFNTWTPYSLRVLYLEAVLQRD